MRNLKRALSLVMAAAMLIGMMAVSASAADQYEDFTDKDETIALVVAGWKMTGQLAGLGIMLQCTFCPVR